MRPEEGTIIEQPTVLNGRYRLTEHIGVGGTADVWRATDELLNREVAVKVLRDAADPTQRERFIEEAQTLASFNHPGLVVLLDAGILDARPFLVMTLAGNSTLASRVARGPVDSSVVKSIGSQIALGLDYVHDRGVVHRDVKPSNVLLWDDGRAVLSDFGIARLIGSTMHHTRTGEAIGSPAYLAPEQIAGEALTPAVDIYSLGLVLLEALTAERAFPGTPVEAAIARLSAAPAVPTSIGRDWASLLTRMTDRNPENRPTARAVAEELSGLEFAASPLADASPGLAVDPEATGAFSILSADAATTISLEPVLSGADAEAEPVPMEPLRHRRRWASLAAVGIAALALAAFTVFHPASGVSKTDAPTVPTKAPTTRRPTPSPLGSAVPTQAASTTPTHSASPSAKPSTSAHPAPSRPLPTATANPTSSPPPAPSPSPPATTPSPTGQTSPQAVTSPSP